MNEIDYAVFAADTYVRPTVTDSLAASPSDVTMDYPDGATLIDTSSIEGLGASDDFVANAYQVGSQIIISYRGTDNLLADALSGWSGLLSNAELGSQVQDAIQFYNDVMAEFAPSSVVLTGHSLGGGLAGVVAALYGKTAYLYDALPFAGAAQHIHDSAADPDDPDHAYWLSLAYPDGAPSAPPARLRRSSSRSPIRRRSGPERTRATPSSPMPPTT
jgi:hypothetical protein